MDGLRQRRVLSRKLFIMVMNDILWNLQDKVHKVRIEYRRLEMVRLRKCAFTGDLMVCGEGERKLQQNVYLWENELKKEKCQ